MGKKPSITPEERRYIYRMISKGYSDREILDEYAEDHANSTIPFPLRTDVRFIKERRKELSAAEDVLRETLTQDVKRHHDSTITKRREDHFAHLAGMASLLLTNELDTVVKATHRADISDPYSYLISVDGIQREASRKQLSTQLDLHLDLLRQRYGDSDLECFLDHLYEELPMRKAQYPNIGLVIEEKPYELIDTLRTLAQRKMFKGKCAVCKDW